MIYLDNAATTFPKPPGVAEAVRDAVLLHGANPGRSGHALSVDVSERVFASRTAAAETLGLENPERLIFTAGCTASLNCVIKGVLRRGDHVLISSLEHNASARPVYALAACGFIRYNVFTVFPGDDARTLRSLACLVRRETRLVVCTMASNVFGVMPPVAEIGGFCRRRGILFCVDAAQTAGLCTFDFPHDYLCCAGHKGLYGPSGLGLLALRSGPVPLPLTEGGTGSASASLAQPDFLPDRLESGTLNVPGILGLAAGLDFVRSETPRCLYLRELALVTCLRDLLERIPGIVLYTAPPFPGCSMPVLAFNLGDLSSEDSVSRLDKAGFALRGGLHCAPLAHRAFGTSRRGAVRVSPAAFNTAADIDSFVRAVARIAHDL